MPELRKLDTGALVNVSDAETPSLLASGKFSLPFPMTNVVSPSGEVFSAQSNNPSVLDILQRGYRIETREQEHQRAGEERYGNRPIAAGLAGAARGLTFGGSDVALTGTGAVDKSTLAGLREFNPGASTAGEVAAIGAATFLTPAGGVGLLARGARGATAAVRGAEALGLGAGRLVGGDVMLLSAPGSVGLAKALGRTAEMATQGVVEGALFGAGQMVSEHALGDTELNAERIMAHVGASALISGAAGGALGGLIGIGSGPAKKALSRFSERLQDIPGVREYVSDAAAKGAQRAAVASVGGLTKLWRKLHAQDLVEEGPEAMLTFLHPDGKPILQPGQSFDKTVQRLNDFVQDRGKSIGVTLDLLDSTGETTGMTPESLAKLLASDILTEFKRRPGAVGQRAATSQFIDDLLSSELSGADLAANGEVTFKWLQQLRNDISKSYSRVEPTDRDRAMRIIERKVNGIMEDAFKRAAPEEFADFKVLKDDFHLLKTITDESTARAATLEANRYFSLSDRITGASMGAAQATSGAVIGETLFGDGDDSLGDKLGNIGEGLIVSLGVQGVMRQLRTRGPSVLAVLLHKFARLAAVEKVATTAAKEESHVIDNLVGEVIHPSRTSPAQTPAASPQNYRVDFTEIVPDDLQLDAGLKRLQPTALVPRETRLARVNTTVDAPTDDARRFAGQQMRLLQGMQGSGGFGAAAKASVSNALGDVAPEITATLANRLVTVMSYLASKAPTPPSQQSLTPGAQSEWKPSAMDTTDFLRRVQAANDPMSVVRSLGSGMLSQQGVETLKTVYPAMYREILRQLLEGISKSARPLSYSDRIALGTLFDLPMADATMAPDFIQLLQETFQKADMQKQAAAHPNPLRLAGLDSLSQIATQASTNPQRIEAGIQ